MKKNIFLLTTLIICSFIISNCNSGPSSTLITQIPTKISPEQHFQTASGLTVDQYELKSAPEVDPLLFVPVQGSQDKILSTHAADRAIEIQDNSFFENFLFGRKAHLGNKDLIAQENFSNFPTDTPEKVSVVVSLNNTVIYTIKAGDASPIEALQGLWTYADHWIVEIASVTTEANSTDNSISLNVTGQIMQDGEMLNEKYGYQETFGSQLIDGKPFYFFKKNGIIGISYDGQTTLLGYDDIPHYHCCSAAEMNPKQAKGMVSFFAQEGEIWYYVEIGSFK
jgi:hypothetical protein